MSDLSLLNCYSFQCSNSHKTEVIIPALQRCHENLLNQVPNSYQDKKENDNAIKEAVYQDQSLHKISQCCDTCFDSVWLHICIILKTL